MSIFVFKRKPEKEVMNLLKRHISLSIEGIKVFKEYIENKNKNLLNTIIKLEKEGDKIRRKLIFDLYSAFLPSMRRELNYAIELLDEVLDSVRHGALVYELMEFEIEENIKEKAFLILDISSNMLINLKSLLEVFEEGGDFEKPMRDIKIGEEKIDDIYHEIYKYMVNIKIDSFWKGKLICDFIDRITAISDYIEDVADEFQIIYIR